MPSSQLPSFEAFIRAGWLPRDPKKHEQWFNKLRERAKPVVTKLRAHHHAIMTAAPEDRKRVEPPPPLLASVQDFKNFIEGDPTVYTEFVRMFEGMASEPMGNKPARPKPTDYHELIGMYNQILHEAPTHGETGPPMFMVMYDIMNTQAGFSAFTKQRLNEHYKAMLQTWVTFLLSRESRYVLTTDENCWFHPDVEVSLMQEYKRSFEKVFICDPEAPYHGYHTYEEFFNRRFREVEADRPLKFPVSDLRIVSAPCESTFFAYQENVKEYETELLIKGEAYSLHHLLCGHSSVPSFVGGTVFQTFLNTPDYHRWHAPINGTIEQIISVPGTYFAQAPSTLNDPHPGGDPEKKILPPYLRSLTYFANTAARLLFFIRGDNPHVGLMCFVAIGMTEISSCEPTARVGQHVNRGDELGMFHFGGSSSLILFNKASNFQIGGEHIKQDARIHINYPIASVGPERVELQQ